MTKTADQAQDHSEDAYLGPYLTWVEQLIVPLMKRIHHFGLTEEKMPLERYLVQVSLATLGYGWDLSKAAF